MVGPGGFYYESPIPEYLWPVNPTSCNRSLKKKRTPSKLHAPKNETSSKCNPLYALLGEVAQLGQFI